MMGSPSPAKISPAVKMAVLLAIPITLVVTWGLVFPFRESRHSIDRKTGVTTIITTYVGIFHDQAKFSEFKPGRYGALTVAEENVVVRVFTQKFPWSVAWLTKGGGDGERLDEACSILFGPGIGRAYGHPNAVITNEDFKLLMDYRLELWNSPDLLTRIEAEKEELRRQNYLINHGAPEGVVVRMNLRRGQTIDDTKPIIPDHYRTRNVAFPNNAQRKEKP